MKSCVVDRDELLLLRKERGDVEEMETSVERISEDDLVLLQVKPDEMNEIVVSKSSSSSSIHSSSFIKSANESSEPLKDELLLRKERGDVHINTTIEQLSDINLVSVQIKRDESTGILFPEKSVSSGSVMKSSVSDRSDQLKEKLLFEERSDVEDSSIEQLSEDGLVSTQVKQDEMTEMCFSKQTAEQRMKPSSEEITMNTDIQKQTKRDDDDTIRTILRIRPRLHKSEKDLPQHINVSSSNSTVIVSPHGRRYPVAKEFSLDHVLGPSSTNSDVYSLLKDSIISFTEGFNATILAFGQSGSGKTHTILGQKIESVLSNPPTEDSEYFEIEDHLAEAGDQGVIIRSLRDIFRETKRIPGHVSLYCSFLEIYNEKTYDLLLLTSQSSENKKLSIRERVSNIPGTTEIFVEGLTLRRIQDVNEALSLVQRGLRQRRTRSTDNNEHSSRSHAVFRIILEIEDSSRGSDVTVLRRSKLTIVDLAGSEKMKDLNTTNVDSFAEHTKINQSLSVLGTVIAALSSKKKSTSTFIPYRNSKLTRLLKDSLGGNTKTTLLAMVGPTSLCTYLFSLLCMYVCVCMCDSHIPYPCQVRTKPLRHCASRNVQNMSHSEQL